MPLNETAEKNNSSGDYDVTWHALSREQVLDKLDSGLDEGLSSQEASGRLDKYGPNQLAEG